MKLDLSITEAAAILVDDEYASWTYRGAVALVEFIEDVEGEDSDLDAVALRCEFSQYDSLQGFLKDYYLINDIDDALFSAGIDLNTKEHSDEEIDEMIESFINDHGILIEFEGGIIVSDF